MQKLFESLFEETPKDEVTKEEFLRNKLSSLKAHEMTAGELMANAIEGGWDSWLRELTFDEFDQLLSEPTSPIPEQGSNQRENGSAKTHTPPGEIDECIVDFLRINPWSDVSIVASGIDLPVDVIEKKLKNFLVKKFVKSVDEGMSARFALM